MRVLAVVPARGGSKGVPGKNLRLAGGRPLVEWSLAAGLASELVDVTVISSDSREILALCKQPPSPISRVFALPRPEELATDEAATDPVLVHAVQAMERFGYGLPEWVVLLQPTVPVRAPGLVDACIRRAQESDADAVFTGRRLHFVWWLAEEYKAGAGPAAQTWETQCPRRPRRQDMYARERMYEEDGSVYVVRTSYLLEHGSRLPTGKGAPGKALLLETEPTVDIDTERDLIVADALLRAQAARPKERSA